MDSLSLPVIHPPFEKLKRSGSWLHFAAGLLILTHALSHSHQHESVPVYFWCQLIISVDIFILVLAGRNALTQIPAVNLFFRLVEILFFLGIGLIMLLAGRTGLGIVHLGLSIAYSYLLYCERKLRSEEMLSFHHIGVTVPGLPEDRFFLWTDINQVEARYDSIEIDTARDEKLRFELRKNLDFGELEQIHEFCRHYLGI
jgi:hypothetical protein